MEVIELEGTAFERGVRYGSALREVIEEGCEYWKQPLKSYPGFTTAEFEQLTGNVLFYMMDHAAEAIEETRGIAHALGRTFYEVFFHNFGQCILAAGPPRSRESCSCFTVDTVDRGPMLGKTEDMPFHPDICAEEAFVVLKVKPAEGLKYVGAGRPGTPWISGGINEAGVAVGVSSGRWSGASGPGQDGHGVPYPYPVKHILQFCGTADEALSYMQETNAVGKGYITMVADAEGRFYCFEKWAHRMGVRKPEDGGLYCANVFVHPDMQFIPRRFDHDKEPALASIEDKFHAHALARTDNFKRLYSEEAEKGAFTEEFAKRVLTYHGEAGSVCRHGADSPADDGAYSYGFLLYCRDRVMMLSKEVPCKAKFFEFAVDF